MNLPASRVQLGAFIAALVTMLGATQGLSMDVLPALLTALVVYVVVAMSFDARSRDEIRMSRYAIEVKHKTEVVEAVIGELRAIAIKIASRQIAAETPEPQRSAQLKLRDELCPVILDNCEKAEELVAKYLADGRDNDLLVLERAHYQMKKRLEVVRGLIAAADVKGGDVRLDQARQRLMSETPRLMNDWFDESLAEINEEALMRMEIAAEVIQQTRNRTAGG